MKTEAEEEFYRLQKELEDVHMERDILKQLKAPLSTKEKALLTLYTAK